jgi:hypothetical protein
VIVMLKVVVINPKDSSDHNGKMIATVRKDIQF